MDELTYIVGDAIETMALLAPESVDLVLTSPPFLGLRDYGDPRQIGTEGSPGEFIGRLLDVVAAAGRVLKPEGSLCVELGDTFSGSGGAGGDYNEGGRREGQARFKANRDTGDRRKVGGENRPGGHHLGGSDWPPGKSLCFIPALFGASLVYGRNLLTGEESPAGLSWRARNHICWARTNPTPGQIHDKVRVGTSYITVACRHRYRYWDAEAIGIPDGEGKLVPPLDWLIEPGEDTWALTNSRGPRSPVAASTHEHFAVWPEELARRLIMAMCPPGGTVLDCFAGTGTTLAAAQGVGRRAIGIELDPRNAELAREKVGMFLTVQQVVHTTNPPGTGFVEVP